MYDELIGNLRAQATHFHFNDETSLLLCQAADAIEDLSREAEVNAKRAMKWAFDAERAEAKLRWIPVTERLPEIGENVLLYAYGRVHFGKLLFLENNLGHPTFLMEQSGLQHSPVLDTTAHNEFTKNRITHWMPLPEPPEKESES